MNDENNTSNDYKSRRPSSRRPQQSRREIADPVMNAPLPSDHASVITKKRVLHRSIRVLIKNKHPTSSSRSPLQGNVMNLKDLKELKN